MAISKVLLFETRGSVAIVRLSIFKGTRLSGGSAAAAAAAATDLSNRSNLKVCQPRNIPEP